MRHYFKVLRRVFGSFLKVPFEDKLLLVKASGLLIFFRLLLKFIALNNLHFFVRFFLKKPSCSYQDNLYYTTKVVWAIEKSGKYILRTRCLAEALAVQVLLNKKKIFSNLQIGFVKDKSKISAHAWVIADNKILIGDTHTIPYYFKITL
jgi:hypothetical protein